jgi:hypothetical protein
MLLRRGRLVNNSGNPPPVQSVPNPRVLVLVLASDTNPIYVEHQKLWRLYMKRNPFVDCYFYKGDPDLPEPASLVGDTLFLKIEDTLDTVYEKTLRAFEYFEPEFPKYKCIFRTNLSSVVIFHAYINYCKTIPSESFCSAYVGIENGVRFPGGAGYTLTPDVATRFIRERPPLVIQDDVSVGYALLAWGIPITGARRLDFISKAHYDKWHEVGIPGDIFHFRVKQQDRHDGGTETRVELELMRTLISRYYGI